MPAGLPEPKPRELGNVAAQADNWITLECSDAEFEAVAAALDDLEDGEFDRIPISASYLIEGGYSILTTTGAYIVVTFREDDDVYDILLAGVVKPPTGLAD